MSRKSPHTPEQRKAIAVAKHLLDLGLKIGAAAVDGLFEQAAAHVLADVGLTLKRKVTPVFEAAAKPSQE